MADLEYWKRRDGVWGAPLWLRVGLVTVAVALFTFRFSDRDLVSYVLDEPQLQDAAQKDALVGRWASINVLHGTQGKRYGPAPLWFYTAVHRLAGPLPERSILATTVLLTVAQLGLALALARALSGGAVIFSVLVALLASSPYLFFWSRTGWDNPLLAAFVDGAVAVLLWGRRLSTWRGALLGLLLGLGLSTHLMAIPFTLAVLLVLGIETWRNRPAFVPFGVLVVVALAVNLPYLWALSREPPSASRALETWGGPFSALERLGPALVEPARVITAAGVDGFLDQAATPFRQDIGVWGWVMESAPALSCVLMLLAVAGFLAAVKGPSPESRMLGALGLLVWGGHALFLGLPALHREPHYQQPTTWLVPAGCCALVMALLPRWRRAAQLLVGVLWVVALADVGFTKAWMDWVRAHGGTAGTHYSVPLSAQRKLLREACSSGRPNVALANFTLLFPHSLLSLAYTEPECSAKRLAICPGRCPALDAQWTVLDVRYAAPPGGRLAVLVRQ